MILGDELN